MMLKTTDGYLCEVDSSVFNDLMSVAKKTEANEI